MAVPFELYTRTADPVPVLNCTTGSDTVELLAQPLRMFFSVAGLVVKSTKVMLSFLGDDLSVSRINESVSIRRTCRSESSPVEWNRVAPFASVTTIPAYAPAHAPVSVVLLTVLPPLDLPQSPTQPWATKRPGSTFSGVGDGGNDVAGGGTATATVAEISLEPPVPVQVSVKVVFWCKWARALFS